MAGIIPEPTSGGLQVRDAEGNTIPQPNVQYAYNPPPEFSISCTLYYLPSDCTARITAAQINGFQSEMLCLAATLNPEGTWNCANSCNLSSAFNGWLSTYLPDAIIDHMCGAPVQTPADFSVTSFLMCNGQNAFRGAFNSVLTPVTLGRAMDPAAVAGSVTADTTFYATNALGTLESFPVTSAIWRGAIGTALCSAPAAAAVPSATGLIACDGSGGIARYPITAAPLRSLFSDVLAGSPATGTLTGTQVVALNASGDTVLLDPSALAVFAPLAPACEVPTIVLARDGVGVTKSYPWVGLRVHDEIEALFATGTGLLNAVNVQNVPGASLTLTNPDPCKVMTVEIEALVVLDQQTQGDGEFNYDYELTVNGVVDPPATINGRFARQGSESEVFTMVNDTVRTRYASVAPGGTLTISARFIMRTTTAFAAGSFSVSMGVQARGISS